MRLRPTSYFLTAASFFIGLWLSGCQAPVSPPATPSPVALSLSWPDSGEINLKTQTTCTDKQQQCISFRVSLLQNGLFQWQREVMGLQQNTMGRWRLDGNQLTLTTNNQHPLILQVNDLQHFSFHGRPLAPESHSLFDQSVRTQARISLNNGKVMISPCPSDLSWPMESSSQSRLLQRLYHNSITNQPGPRRAITILHLSPDRQQIHIDQFIALEPGECD